MRVSSAICLLLSLPFSFVSTTLFDLPPLHGGEKVTVKYLRRHLNKVERELNVDKLATFGPEAITEAAIQIYRPVIRELSLCEIPSEGLRMIFKSYYNIFGQSLQKMDVLLELIRNIGHMVSDPNYFSELRKVSDEFENLEEVGLKSSGNYSSPDIIQDVDDFCSYSKEQIEEMMKIISDFENYSGQFDKMINSMFPEFYDYDDALNYAIKNSMLYHQVMQNAIDEAGKIPDKILSSTHRATIGQRINILPSFLAYINLILRWLEMGKRDANNKKWVTSVCRLLSSLETRGTEHLDLPIKPTHAFRRIEPALSRRQRDFLLVRLANYRANVKLPGNDFPTSWKISYALAPMFSYQIFLALEPFTDRKMPNSEIMGYIDLLGDFSKNVRLNDIKENTPNRIFRALITDTLKSKIDAAFKNIDYRYFWNIDDETVEFLLNSSPEPQFVGCGSNTILDFDAVEVEVEAPKPKPRKKRKAKKKTKKVQQIVDVPVPVEESNHLTEVPTIKIDELEFEEVEMISKGMEISVCMELIEENHFVPESAVRKQKPTLVTSFNFDDWTMMHIKANQVYFAKYANLKNITMRFQCGFNPKIITDHETLKTLRQLFALSPARKQLNLDQILHAYMMVNPSKRKLAKNSCCLQAKKKELIFALQHEKEELEELPFSIAPTVKLQVVDAEKVHIIEDVPVIIENSKAMPTLSLDEEELEASVPVVNVVDEGMIELIEENSVKDENGLSQKEIEQIRKEFQETLEHYKKMKEVKIDHAKPVKRFEFIPESAARKQKSTSIVSFHTDVWRMIHSKANEVFIQNQSEGAAKYANLKSKTMKFQWIFNPEIVIDRKTFKTLCQLFSLSGGQKELTFDKILHAYAMINPSRRKQAENASCLQTKKKKVRFVFQSEHAFQLNGITYVPRIGGAHPEHKSSRFNRERIHDFFMYSGAHPYFFFKIHD